MVYSDIREFPTAVRSFLRLLPLVVRSGHSTQQPNGRPGCWSRMERKPSSVVGRGEKKKNQQQREEREEEEQQSDFPRVFTGRTTT